MASENEKGPPEKESESAEVVQVDSGPPKLGDGGGGGEKSVGLESGETNRGTENGEAVPLITKDMKEQQKVVHQETGGWGWGGGWAAAVSMVSALQEVANEVTDEISKTAVAAARSVVESLDEEERKAVEEQERVRNLEEKEQAMSKKYEEEKTEKEGKKQTGNDQGDIQEQAPAKKDEVTAQESSKDVGGGGGAVESLPSASTEGREKDVKVGASAADKEADKGQPVQSSVADGKGKEDGPGLPAKEQKQQPSSDEGIGRKLEAAKSGGQLEGNEQSGQPKAIEKDPLSIDESVESLATGALQALGSAWIGGLSFVQRLEQSAGSLASSLKDGNLAPSLLESGRGLAEKSMQVLEYMSMEAMDIIVAETGIELEKEEGRKEEEIERRTEGEEVPGEGDDEISFYRCFYIYGGPGHLEELEALADHYTVLCIRARGKMGSGDERVVFDSLVKNVQELLTLPPSTATDAEGEKGEQSKGPQEKGKEKDPWLGVSMEEVDAMQEAAISTAATLSAGFGSTVGSDVEGRARERLMEIRTEGIHRIAEISALCVSHLLLLAQSLLHSSSSSPEVAADEGDDGGNSKKEQEDPKTRGGDGEATEWPKECSQIAHVLKARAWTLARKLNKVVACFVMSISKVLGAVKGTGEGAQAKESEGKGKRKEEGSRSLEAATEDVREELEGGGAEAYGKLRDGLQQLVYVVISTCLS